MIQVKELTKLEDIESVRAVDRLVWNADVMPVHQLYTAANNGGLVLGAYVDDQLVGFQYSFAGYKDGNTYLCSHMLGILPDYRNRGIGVELKKLQKQLAIEMGYSLIVWTYDPLESANAYLNLHRLKGIGAKYLVNYYGVMNDALNKGLPTDRFLVEWWIQSDHVNDEPKCQSYPSEEPVFETALDHNNLPYIVTEIEVDISKDYVFVPIPSQFQHIKAQDPELAMEWRLRSRKWFVTLCENGYVAVDLIPNQEKRISTYVFTKRNHLSLGDE